MKRLHHIAIFTGSYAKTRAFYVEIFDAKAPEQPTQPAVIEIGGVTLHVFERPEISATWNPTHIHHFALEADTLPEFSRIRGRLHDRNASDGAVIHFGTHVSLLASDPDGGMIEVLCAVEDGQALPFETVPHE